MTVTLIQATPNPIETIALMASICYDSDPKNPMGLVKHLYRNGHHSVFEHMFKKAEKKMLKLVLRICRDLTDIDLRLKDIDMKFTRRNYEAIQSKAQVLISMLQQPKIHPMLAFSHCGLFTDPESAYAVSMKYYEEEQEKLLRQQQAQNPSEDPDDDETEE